MISLRVPAWPFAAAVVLAAGCSEEIRFTTTSVEAREAYAEGVKQMEMFYYAEAQKSLDRAVDADSNFAMALGRKALLAFRMGQDSAARACAARAVSAAPGASLRERLYVSAWSNLVTYHHPAAAAAADSLIELYPDDGEAHVLRGSLYEIDKNLEAAIETYAKAAEGEDAYPLAVMSLGYAYSSIGEQEKALEAMRRYIAMAPEAADPRASYADLLLRFGKYDEAMEQYERSLELKPDYWYAFSMIAKVHAIRGRLRESERMMDRAYELLPPSRDLEAERRAALAGFAFSRGNYEEAERMSLEALATDTTLGGAAFVLTNALIKQGQYDAADRVLDRIRSEIEARSLQASPVMADFHAMRARVLSARGEQQEALTALEEALEYTNTLNRTYVQREMAEVYLRQGETESALDACAEALSVNTNAPQALLTLTRVYHAQGDARMTREVGERLLRLWKDADPDFKDAEELKRLLAWTTAV
jgi:tetratricopeptide (TPR) repeat protein